MQKFGILALALLTFATPVLGSSPETIHIPKHGRAVQLFDGRDLHGLHTFLKSHGADSDPDGIFRVENGELHVSGHEMGYVITERSFKRFYLCAEFKWGEGTFGERAGQARDSGILFAVQGPDKVWPRSIEFQITEGGTGDFWLTDGAALTGPNGIRVTGPAGTAKPIARIGKDPVENHTGFRPVHELEEAHGEWNQLQLIVDETGVRQYVNGKLANQGTDPFPADGRILFQSEGAEIFFRNMVLYPIK